MTIEGRHARHEDDRLSFNRILGDAGWEPEPVRKDAADLEYDNGKVVLRVVQSTKNPRFNLSFNWDDDEALVNVEYGAHLETTLKKLIAVQDQVRPDNVDDILNELHEAADEIFVYEDDELVPIHRASELLTLEREAPLKFVEQKLMEEGWQKVNERTFDFHGDLAQRVIFAARKDDTASDALYFLVGKKNPGTFTFIVYPNGRLGDLIRHVVAWQSDLRADNFKKTIGGLVTAFPSTYLFEDGKASLLTSDAPAVEVTRLD